MAGYIPNTAEQQREMLSAAGFEDFDGLFADIPESVRLHRPLNLPDAMSEPEVIRHLRSLSKKNTGADDYVCFLGAGAYDHYIPSVVGHLISRQEFQTAYTPYQPEISQGTLQAIFEFQSLICELTGMEVANASMYDGATALAEAASMACTATRRKRVLLAASVNPMDRQVVETYARFRGNEIIPFGCVDGQADLDELARLLSEETAAVCIQSPNFFGCVEDLERVSEQAHAKGAMLLVSCDPISLGLLKSPGELGADVVVGEAQCLGNPLDFGGPYLGFFAAKSESMRKLPGRIVGKTTDSHGNEGFVLTLQAREQHIRRGKATSNICSNEALCALSATIYLSLLGKQGLREVALQCARKAKYAYDTLLGSGVFEPMFAAPFFKEFTVRYRGDVEALNRALLKDGILGGFSARRADPALEGGWIVAVTEKRTRAEIDELARKAVQYCGQ